MVGRWIALLAMVSGCDWILGIRAFGPGDADYSGDLGMVQGSYRQHWLENDAAGAPVPQDTAPKVADLAMSNVVLDDGSRRPITFADDGTFTFTTATIGQHYALEIATPYVDTVYETDATMPALVERFPGRIDRQQVVGTTPVTLPILGQLVTHPKTKEELHTTGIWSQRSALAYDVTAMKFSLDYATVDGIGGPMGLLDGSRHDALYYAHYTNTDPTPPVEVRLDVTAKQADATIANATANTFSLIATNVMANDCANIAAEVGAEASRLTKLHANAVVYETWAINAHPTDEFAATTRYPLAYGIPTTPTFALMPNFGNPYPGSSLDAEITLVGIFDGASIATTTIIPIPPTQCPAATVARVLVGVVAIPDAPMLGQTSLLASGPAIALDRSKPITVTWAAAAGNADYYLVKLQEVLATTPAIRVRDVVTVVTTQTSAAFDPKYFAIPPTYRIEIVARAGSPKAAQGDFSESNVASATATTDSVPFKVQ